MSAAALVQCTFVGNAAPEGSNISADCDGDVSLDRCLVTGGVGGAGVYVDGGSSAVFTCTDIWGNPAGDWVAPFADQLGQDGNIAADPQFCDAAAGDYTVAATSPCAPEHSGGCGQIGAWPVGCAGVTAAPLPATPPGRVVLAPSIPNPFNPATKLSYAIPEAGPVRLAIHGLDGRLVAVLVSGSRPAGRHEATWRGRDDSGRNAPSGTYLAVLEAAGERRTRSLVLLR